jgi:hypothetical protein
MRNHILESIAENQLLIVASIFEHVDNNDMNENLSSTAITESIHDTSNTSHVRHRHRPSVVAADMPVPKNNLEQIILANIYRKRLKQLNIVGEGWKRVKMEDIWESYDHFEPWT